LNKEDFKSFIITIGYCLKIYLKSKITFACSITGNVPIYSCFQEISTGLDMRTPYVVTCDMTNKITYDSKEVEFNASTIADAILKHFREDYQSILPEDDLQMFGENETDFCQYLAKTIEDIFKPIEAFSEVRNYTSDHQRKDLAPIIPTTTEIEFPESILKFNGYVCGALNYLVYQKKDLPQGKSFKQTLLQDFAGLDEHYHPELTKQLKSIGSGAIMDTSLIDPKLNNYTFLEPYINRSNDLPKKLIWTAGKKQWHTFQSNLEKIFHLDQENIQKLKSWFSLDKDETGNMEIVHFPNDEQLYLLIYMLKQLGWGVKNQSKSNAFLQILKAQLESRSKSLCQVIRINGQALNPRQLDRYGEKDYTEVSHRREKLVQIDEMLKTMRALEK